MILLLEFCNNTNKNVTFFLGGRAETERHLLLQLQLLSY
jgi:hypothetical protein